MFTGLVESVGTLNARMAMPGGARLRIGTPLASELALGDSIAVNGVCLTVVEHADGEMSADIGPETIRVTTLGDLRVGAFVNLERPLRVDGRLGGHLVQGHVDGIGHVEAVGHDQEFSRLTVRFPRELAALVILKGSIAIDGISLTVARLGTDRLDIMIVPFTIEHTNLKAAQEGDAVNIECDMVGKYVARAVELAGLTARK